MSVREDLIAGIKAVVDPARVAVIGVEDNKDVLDRLTIMVKQRTIAPLAQAPIGALRVDYVLTVTSPAIDPAVAEPELDDFVPDLLNDLSPIPWFGWSEATKILDGQNLAYDISAFVLASPTGEGQ